ncbi:MAG TPA: glycosyltransferase family 4 protein [Cyclobacteriaceae bacterium]|nr:glycosyltransferase family 4 protein [Cyclobacteriaceae bacterium]
MKSLLILYPHFYPSFKGGGPVQSLTNLVELLHNECKISVVCSAYDLGESTILEGIKPDEWNSYLDSVDVFYATSNGYSAVRSALEHFKPDIIYLNGMFSPSYNWLPLVLVNKSKQQVIISPRGMLQGGALALKPLKKKIFLTLFKLLGLHKNISWHATDLQEEMDIRIVFGANARVTVAPNIPKKPLQPKPRKKQGAQLRLVFLSLITEKKNVHVVLEALKLVKLPITFHIFGPVKDHRYWERCKALMQDQIHAIEYLGSVNPNEVQNQISKYDAFILPTKGENFGHAIYESLSVGTPVIISKHTPWKVAEKRAGFVVESEAPEKWAWAIERFYTLDENEYSALSAGAHALAKKYFEENNFMSQYRRLFQL